MDIEVQARFYVDLSRVKARIRLIISRPISKFGLYFKQNGFLGIRLDSD